MIWGRVRLKKYHSFQFDYKRSFSGDSTNGKVAGISVMNAKCTILKKMNVSFILHFCPGKYSLSLNTFWAYHELWRKCTFRSFFIFCPGKYSLSLNTLWTHVVFWRKWTFHFLLITHSKYSFSLVTCMLVGGWKIQLLVLEKTEKKRKTGSVWVIFSFSWIISDVIYIFHCITKYLTLIDI